MLRKLSEVILLYLSPPNQTACFRNQLFIKRRISISSTRCHISFQLYHARKGSFSNFYIFIISVVTSGRGYRLLSRLEFVPFVSIGFPLMWHKWMIMAPTQKVPSLWQVHANRVYIPWIGIVRTINHSKIVSVTATHILICMLLSNFRSMFQTLHYPL